MVGSARSEVLGQYTIYERLGQGGMATVNRAEMQGLAGFRKQVALKRLLPEIAKDPSMVQSFVHEARLASCLHHPNIGQTYDLGKVDETYFIAMEYISGPTLAQLLRPSSAAPVPIPIALSILGQICDALDYAHNLRDADGQPLGIIHRDVSPSNIIISRTGIVKLIDFGIAKVVGSDRTDPGLIKGKPSYMAPESFHGQVDARADLFGLGVVAHELLTGRSLFHARNDFDTMERLREMPILPPSHWNPAVPADLDDIVLTALQREPGLRWQSAAAMRTALANVAMSCGTPATHHQVLAWVKGATAQSPPREDRALQRAVDARGERSRLARGSGIDLERQLATDPRPPGERHADPEERTAPASRQAPRRSPAPGASSAPRAWLLLLLLLMMMIAVAALAGEELATTARELYARYAG